MYDGDYSKVAKLLSREEADRRVFFIAHHVSTS